MTIESGFSVALAIPFGNADPILVVLFLLLVVGLPALGYALTIMDIRAYLRSLKGALIIVKNHIPTLPTWAQEYTPNSVRSLGLQMPCSESDVKKAYRKLAETMHPDRGGDRQEFLALQSHFEEAIDFVREMNEEKKKNRR